MNIDTEARCQALPSPDRSPLDHERNHMNRARLITNLEALLRFDLAHQVRAGLPLSSITIKIAHDAEAFEIWDACLIDAGFPSAA